MLDPFVQQLRLNSTEAERRLWTLLRDRRLAGYKFRRQHPIDPFIADFACTRHKLVVEADGGQHAGSDTDEARTAFLICQGWRVLRFWNNEILTNPAGVIETILGALSGG